jgi:hypothetical protein
MVWLDDKNKREGGEHTSVFPGASSAALASSVVEGICSADM